mgnify:CR=1 FL=1
MFEEFRDFCFTHYELDPEHYVSLPGFSWDALMKSTGVELELLTQPEMYLFIERAIRGGYAGIVHREASANNQLMGEGYDVGKPSSHIAYWDANNLYGHAMSRPMPTGGFEWMDQPGEFDLHQLTARTGVGYVLEVDLHYPKRLHELHSDLPLAPEQRWLHYHDLSAYSKQLLDASKGDGTEGSGRGYYAKKLCQTLFDKKAYVVHGRILQLYLELGLQVTRIYKVLKFNESPWMEPYIAKNTVFRQQATSAFHKDLFKLLNNSIFGKSIQNNRKQRNVRIITTTEELEKTAARPYLKRWQPLRENLVVAELIKPVIKIDRPIYVGFSVLELSKEHINRFH